MTSFQEESLMLYTAMNRRRFIRLGGMGLAGAVLVACGGNGGTATTAGATATTAGGAATTMAPGTTAAGGGVMANLSTIVVGDFNPNYAAQWGYHVADAKGWMAEYGIETQEYQLSEEYVPGLLGGSLDVTHGDTNVLMGSAVASGEPIKMISMYRTSEWQIIGVAAGIETAEDLVGQAITGGQLEGRNTYVQRKILVELGIDPEDVEFVATSGGSDGRLQALIANTVQAASVFPRHRAALEEAGGKFLYENLVAAPQEGFGAMQGWLDENGDTATAWVTAELKGRVWLSDPANKEEAFQIMLDRGFEVPQEFQDLYDVEIEQFSPDGGFDADEMDAFIAELVEIGDLPEGIEWRDHFEPAHLWAAQDELGIPRRPEM